MRKPQVIMLSRLHLPFIPAPAPQPTASPVTRIEVKAGNLGTQMGFGRKIIVRVVKRHKIEVRHEN